MGNAPEAVRIRTLKTHIQRLLMAFETIHSFDFHPKRIGVSGGAMTIEAIEKAVPALDIPVERVSIAECSEIRVESAVDGQSRDAANNPLALTVVDLQMPDSLNFYQQRHALYHYWEAHKSNIIKTAVGALLVFFLAMGSLIYDIQRLQARVEKMEAEKISLFRSTFPGVTRIEDPYLQMQINVRESRGKDQFAGLRESGVLNIDVLNDLSRLIPPDIDVVMTRFVRGQGSVLLSGHTDTFNAVDDIKGALYSSKLFTEITISSANMDKSNNRVQFKLKIELSAAG
jgi:general secretion pathway protein L